MTTISTLLHLQEELNQFSKEKLTLGLKYKLAIFMEDLKKLTIPVETQRNNLIKELSGGTNTIPQEIENAEGTKIPNPKFTEFTTQFSSLLNTEASLPSTTKFICLEDIEKLESEFTYPLIFKHLTYKLEKVNVTETN